jgi:hypothetical protein
MYLRHACFISIPLWLLLAGCHSDAVKTSEKKWEPRELSWSHPEPLPHDTGIVHVTGYLKLPLEMTTAEDRGSLELWERRNQRTGVDLHLSIAMGEGVNEQQPLPAQYADSSLVITGADGETIRYQNRVEVTARWMDTQSDVLEVIRIYKADRQLPLPDSVYTYEISRKNIRSGEAEGRLVFAEGFLVEPSIVLQDQDIDLEFTQNNLRVAARVLIGNGPSQMRPAKNIAGKGQLLDLTGQPLQKGKARVYGVFHDGRIYVEEIAPAAAPVAPSPTHPKPGLGKVIPVDVKKQ